MGREFTKWEDHLLWVENEVSVLKSEGNKDMSDEIALNIFRDVVKKYPNPIRVFEALRKMLEGELLSPIRDEDSEFEEIASEIYQSKRWPSMYYLLDPSGKKFIIDSQMVATVDIHDPNTECFESFAMSYFYRDCLKLEFPYTPPEYPWVVYIERCKANKGDYYDTLGICYAKLPGTEKLIEIKKFFKRRNEGAIWEEITASDYAFRCKKGGLLDDGRKDS